MSSINSLLSVASVSDAVLISATRGGDASAFAEIAQRHDVAALAAARCLTESEPDAQAVVAEACTRLADVVAAGSGPEMVIRPDLLMIVRAVARERGITGDERPPAVDPADGEIALASFRSLPERWQLVIWHGEVEGASSSVIAPLLGLPPDAVEALSQRARDGLRQALLRAHLRDDPADECRFTAERLGSFVRDGLSIADRASVESHLEQCDRCRGVVDSLGDLGSRLRRSLLPAVVGAPADEYLGQLTLAATGAATRRRGPRGQGRARINGRAVSAGVTLATVVGIGVAVFAATRLGAGPAAAPNHASALVGVPAAASAGVPIEIAPGASSNASTLAVQPRTAPVPTSPPVTTSARPPLPAPLVVPTSTLPVTPGVTASSTSAPPLPSTTDVSTTSTSAVTAVTTAVSTTGAPEVVPELSIRASMSGPAVESQSLAIEVQIANVGGSPARLPRVEIASPEGVTLVLAAGSAWHCTSGTTMTCDGPSLGAGAGSSFFMIASLAPVSKPAGRDPGPPVRSITSPVRLRVYDGPNNNATKRGVDVVIGDVKPNPTASTTPSTTAATPRATGPPPASSHDRDK